MTSHKPTAGFWLTVALVVVLVGYPLSYGVAAWLWWRELIPSSLQPALEWLYAPVTWAILDGPRPISAAVMWYAELWHR